MANEQNDEQNANLARLMNQIKEALVNLVHLQIVTAVGHVSVTLKRDGSVNSLDIEEKPKAISTCIDLLQGDITTVFDPEFVTGTYQSLRDFHAAREKEGHDIVQKNLAAIQALFTLIQNMATKKL